MISILLYYYWATGRTSHILDTGIYIFLEKLAYFYFVIKGNKAHSQKE